MTKRLFILVLLVFAAGMVLAQDAAELTETTDLGEILVQHPEGWVFMNGQGENLLLSNVDFSQFESVEDYPPESLIIQLSIVATDFVAELPEDPNAVELLNALPKPENVTAEVQGMEVNGMEVASLDVSADGNDARVYSYLVGENSFVFAIAAAPIAGAFEGNEEILLQVLSTLELNVTAPLPDYLPERYENIAQGTTDEGFPLLGSADAPVTVLDISSFDCPACGNFHDNVFPELLPRIEAGEINFVYVPIWGTGGIPGGDTAAQSAVCAGQQDAFWQYHDAIFTWQSFGLRAFIGERLVQGVDALELDKAAWAACLTDETSLSVFQAAFEYAQTNEFFTGTPTILVNGAPVGNSVEAVNTAIADALAAPADEGEAPEDETTDEETTTDESDE